jgi:hypothetical protein
MMIMIMAMIIMRNNEGGTYQLEVYAVGDGWQSERLWLMVVALTWRITPTKVDL